MRIEIIVRFAFVLMMLLVANPQVSAYKFAVDGICYNIIEEDGIQCAQVTQGAKRQPEYNGKIVIPATVTYQGATYSVTSIDELAFYDYDNLMSVKLPSTITSIGSEAFYHCTNLSSITLPESLKKIGSNAFSDCGFTSINIPKNVNSLYRNVFSRCSKLRTITVDAANSVYDSRGNCNAIIETAEDNLMTGCMNTVIPSDINVIGPSAFSGCTGLTSIVLPSGLGSISFYAFSGCMNLASISFPNSVWSVGDQAFSGCSSLKTLHITKRLTSLGENPFEGCSGLTSITVDEENYQYDSRGGCNAIIDKKKNVFLTGCQNSVIPEGVVKIGKYAFRDCSTLSSISIPNSVTIIENYAFYGCSSLISASVPNSVKKIGGGAFSGCSSLESFVIPDGVTNLGSILSGCNSLKSIVIPAGVTQINSTVFNGCKDLTSIVVESGNTVFDSRNNCNAIIETATNKLIVGCLTTVVPSDVTTIGDYAFKGCGNMESFIVPEGVSVIESYAFEDCTSLLEIQLPNSLTTLSEGAFENCISLKEITIPIGVSSINSYVFYGCQQLTDVTVKSPTPFSISDNTFDDASLITLHVPKGSKSAYETSMYWMDFKDIIEDSDDTDVLIGDANGDGKLTVADYIAVAHYILGRISANFNEKAADVNGDEKINVADYTGVVHLLLYGTVVKPKDK